VSEAAAILGPLTFHVWFLGMGDLLRIEDENRMLRQPGEVPFGDEFTLPTGDGEIGRVVAEAARGFGREGGRSTFEASINRA
jgi:hypothetical protein